MRAVDNFTDHVSTKGIGRVLADVERKARALVGAVDTLGKTLLRNPNANSWDANEPRLSSPYDCRRGNTNV